MTTPTTGEARLMKACPFCGEWLIHEGSFYMHSDVKCALEHTVFHQDSETAILWNTRPTTPAPEAVEDIDVEIAIAEAIQLMPRDHAYEDKGGPVLKYLKQLGYSVVKTTPPKTGDQPEPDEPNLPPELVSRPTADAWRAGPVHTEHTTEAFRQQANAIVRANPSGELPVSEGYENYDKAHGHDWVNPRCIHGNMTDEQCQECYASIMGGATTLNQSNSTGLHHPASDAYEKVKAAQADCDSLLDYIPFDKIGTLGRIHYALTLALLPTLHRDAAPTTEAEIGALLVVMGDAALQAAERNGAPHQKFSDLDKYNREYWMDIFGEILAAIEQHYTLVRKA